ncbi:MAG: response regulator [Candidatus Omnitrophica bacterium]|nr:response regulator [Candidatus Omnitrophota bacterium]MBU4303168.1 response regulator [Candidatus Omnitrophota bacterium]MBU4468052.1 response regulator [Candidatus Omnitrophota bacterium]MCG2707589.1 response regulator [Candidatus Omnitrophota bacterium]
MHVRGKILLVDDNEDLCRNLADILKLKKYEVTVVYDGTRAIEAIKKRGFDVVLMDVKMPGISGIETLKIIKQINPDLSVIFITAFADDIFYKQGLKDGDVEVVQKPMDIDKFLDRINTIVTKKRIR